MFSPEKDLVVDQKVENLFVILSKAKDLCTFSAATVRQRST
jgi:hypothetical protein